MNTPTTAQELVEQMADAFCRWPLPPSVCADLCATHQGGEHRTGTNLLSVLEAKAAFEALMPLVEQYVTAQKATATPITDACVNYDLVPRAVASEIERQLRARESELTVELSGLVHENEKLRAEIESSKANNRYHRGYSDGELESEAKVKQLRAEVAARKATP